MIEEVMIEKYLDLGQLQTGEIKRLERAVVRKLMKDLETLGLYSDEEVCTFETEHDGQVFRLLRLTPDSKDGLNGNHYIQRDFNKKGKTIKSLIYNFGLQICSTCG